MRELELSERELEIEETRIARQSEMERNNITVTFQNNAGDKMSFSGDKDKIFDIITSGRVKEGVQLMYSNKPAIKQKRY